MDNAFQKNKDEISAAIGMARDKGDEAFLSWFNKSAGSEQDYVRGAWDFSFYFANSDVCSNLKDPESKTCLEIGYGGGRLLNASRAHFRFSHGVDIHPFRDAVKTRLLELHPREDFALHQLDQVRLPLADNSIDYAYSFVVIQHFYAFSILASYMKELARVVKTGGLANLFFADLRLIDKPTRYLTSYCTKGYVELVAPPDATTAHNSLWISRWRMAKELSRNGFRSLLSRPSYKNVPDGYPCRRGSQTGILAIKEGR